MFDKAVGELFGRVGVAPELVRGAPGPALHARSPETRSLALTTAPDALPAGVISRTLDPGRTLSFELLSRDEAPSPAVDRIDQLAAATAQRTAATRSLAAVA